MLRVNSGEKNFFVTKTSYAVMKPMQDLKLHANSRNMLFVDKERVDNIISLLNFTDPKF